MAASDARPVPIKNTAYRVYFPILDADGDLVTGATGLDSERSLDSGTFADCTNEATEVATSSGIYYLDLSNTEMNTDCTVVIVKTTTVGAKTTVLTLYPVEAGDIDVDVTSWNGTAVATPDTAGYPKVTIKSGTGTGEISMSSGVANTNVAQISGDSAAADNLETAFDGGSYNAGGGGIVAASVTGAVGSVTGAVGSVTGSVGGNVTGSVGSVAGNVTGSVGSLATQAKADVNAEVLDVLTVDTFAEPASVPAATASLKDKIGFLMALARNKLVQTTSGQALRNDADNADIGTNTNSDNGAGTFTRGEWS